MVNFYQIDPGLDPRSHLEKLNFILRQLQKNVSSLAGGTDNPTLSGGGSGGGGGGGGGTGGDVNTTAPLSGGGTPPVTLSISKATSSVDGYLAAVDWVTFNAKVPSSRTINTTSPLTGGGNLSSDLTIALTMGPGSGLDADTVDGQHASSFSASGHTHVHSALTSLIAPADDHTQYLHLSGIRPMTGGLSPAVANLTDAATIAINCALGNHFRVTLGGNRMLGNPSGAVDGQRIVVELTQDATGSRLLTLDSQYVKPSNLPDVILSTSAGKTDMIAMIRNSVLNKWVITGFLKEYV